MRKHESRLVKVLLATAAERVSSHQLQQGIEELARIDRFGKHVLTRDARDADVILFLDSHQQPGDWSMRVFRKHRLVREFPRKVFVYDERDAPRPLLPGLYVSMPRRTFDVTRQRAFAYYFLPNDTRAVSNPSPDLLFCFQGRRIQGVREAVLGLTHPRAVIEDTSDYDFFGARDFAVDNVMARYREIVGRSKFVLCPRGAGTSSLRLFEALACGRVPVILSDDWAEPQGIDWASCSVRIPERDAISIGEHLEALEPSWLGMSAAAKRVYGDHFAPDVWFHRAIEHCCELKEGGLAHPRQQWTNPSLWRDGARYWKHRLLGTVR